MTHAKLFVVFGACDYLRRREVEAVEAVEAEVEQCRPHAVTRIAAVDDFATLCHQSDLFAAKTLYVITTTDEMCDLWEYICEHGLSNTLIFDYQRKELSKKLQRLCKDAQALVTPCPEPKPYSYPSLLAKMCKEKGLQLDAAGQRALLQVCGNNLDFLSNEMDKLMLLFGKQRISRDDIASHLGILREDTVFLLTDLLLQRKYNQAHTAVEKFIRRGDPAVKLLGVLAYFVRNMQHSLDNALPDRMPSKIRSLYANLQLEPPTHLMRLRKECQQADACLKTSTTSAELAIFDVIESLRSNTKA